MIKIENTEVLGWEASIRGCRNPMNSWEKSDSWFEDDESLGDRYYHDISGECHSSDSPDDKYEYRRRIEELDQYSPCLIGPNDHKLMMNLAKAGSVDAKYRRMIVVYADITAPLYWWKEFDTYKVGTVANSCSTMHKIHTKEFTLEDFSCEHLIDWDDIDIPDEFGPENPLELEDQPVILRNRYNIDQFDGTDKYLYYSPKGAFRLSIEMLNKCRELYLKTKDKKYWWQMIQLLPSSYNQRRTVMMNYEVLAGIYPKRKDHMLDCWHDFCDWIKSLPYSEIITLEEKA